MEKMFIKSVRPYIQDKMNELRLNPRWMDGYEDSIVNGRKLIQFLNGKDTLNEAEIFGVLTFMNDREEE
jgi:hypothetical protein